MGKEKLTTHAVILAGGRGTRFWPRSRTRAPKQLLNIVGKKTMLEQTIERLLPMIPAERIWTVTNIEQAAQVRRQLPAKSRRRVLAEPVGRNTSAAIALAALHVQRAAGGDALLAVLPADHYIADADRFRKVVGAALEAAREPGRMVVLGIPPKRPETGFGYIERMGEAALVNGLAVFAVRQFTEKPELQVAKHYVESSNFYWNAGMFFWRVSTFLDNLKQFLPKTHAALQTLAGLFGTRQYESKVRAIYSKLENISVDYAILEPATRQAGPPRVFVIPAEIGWSDIGSWAAVYELLAKGSVENVSSGASHFLDSQGNFVWSPDKFAALIGVRGLVVVETPDALLICPRDRAQDVAKIVKWLEENRRNKLL